MAGDSNSEMKMEALKKVYAEIILNTSKEAASRVMLANRKAGCFEHQLHSLKHDSLSMLLRFKHHFNSTIMETEARSLKQQMKIEELEAQLCKAEGIIVDLRGELKQVHEQLEMMSQNQKEPLNKPVQESAPEDNAPIMLQVSDTNTVSVDYEKKVSSLHTTALNYNRSVKLHLDQFDTPNDEFSSIVIQKSQTDLCRNGSTQRIRAFEGNLSNVRPQTSQSEDQKFLLDIQLTTNTEKTVNRMQYENDNVNSSQEPLSSFDKSHPRNISSGQSLHHSNCYKDQATRSLRRSAQKNARYREAIASLQGSRKKYGRTRLQPFLGPLKRCSSVVNVQAVEIPIEIIEMDPKEIKVCRESISDNLSCNSKTTVCASEGSDAELREASVDEYHTISGDALQHSVLVDVPISEGSGSSYRQLGGADRVLKYTFRRKRRKSSLGKSDENSLLENEPIMRRLENPGNVGVVEKGIFKDATRRESGKMS